MIEAVMVFGLVSALFEAIILVRLPPKFGLRLLGSGFATGLFHALIVIVNLFIHWGTITGSMTAIVAGLASFATVPLVKRYTGYISNKRYYPGVKRYGLAEIR